MYTVANQTTVTMTLPPWKRMQFHSAEAATPRASDAPRGGDEARPEAWTRTILLVEDNAYLAAMAEMLLETLGYKIKYAATARQALDMLAGDAAVDAVFTDILMPGGMSGVEFAKVVRDRSPALPIVLTTGSPAAAAEARTQGFLVLERPCPVDILESALRGALAQSPSALPEAEKSSDGPASVVPLNRRRVA